LHVCCAVKKVTWPNLKLQRFSEEYKYMMRTAVVILWYIILYLNRMNLGFLRPKPGTDQASFFSTLCYSRDLEKDALAGSKSPGEKPVDVVPTKTDSSNNSYRIYMSMRTHGRGLLKCLTTVAKPNQYEANCRNPQLDPCHYSHDVVLMTGF